MMKVPLIKPDLPAFHEIEGPFREVLESGKITNFGQFVTQFEADAGAFLGTQVATVSSGTLGLILTLQALGLERGQKVILPSFTFMATAQAVLYAGGVPVFADIGEDMTLSPTDLETLLNRHEDVAVVLPVHMYGLPCQVGKISQVVNEAAQRLGRSIAILYDAAHAFGAELGGQRVGSFGAAEVFSLSVTKLLVSVEGGLVSSRDPDLIRVIRRMRNYGIEQNYDAQWPGLNGKMSELHAIIGLQNLRKVRENLAVRTEKAAHYTRYIEDSTCFRTIPVPPESTHTFKDFTVLVPPSMRKKRDAIIRFLSNMGVETRAYFDPPVHRQSYFMRFATRTLPTTEDYARRVITLPFFTSISEAEMSRVVAALAEAERTFTQSLTA
ncbi:MAG: DegT/DnrJ/EryC1/StrS family aminotransferase [Acidobacteria bacterium]|nr:DegT/DnrJ/EryC1/StrS family aminotransferase [Acidobacteriota bacterium]MBI3656036.1 DegT/DnrJ/EryC1/StrS family aminotransferase [Acidobacteriota bacterium]